MPDLPRVVFLTPPPVSQEQRDARIQRTSELPAGTRIHYLTDDAGALPVSSQG